MLRPMDRLDRYRIFMQVAEMGSFIKAAHALLSALEAAK